MNEIRKYYNSKNLSPYQPLVLIFLGPTMDTTNHLESLIQNKIGMVPPN